MSQMVKQSSGGGGGGTVNTLTGNSGVATAAGGNINVVTQNATVRFVGSGSTLTQNFAADSNLVLGTSLPSLTTGSTNAGFGPAVMINLTSGQSNTGIGVASLIGLSSGDNNTCVGSGAGDSIVSGSFNTLIGSGAGQSYSLADSNNICIGNSGNSGQNNEIRIGTQGSGPGEQDTCFIAGIANSTVSNQQTVVVDTVSGQIGSIQSVQFQAYRTTNQTVAGGSTAETIIFDSAMTNIGAGYNTANGVFTAPSTGFYSFACTAFFSDLNVPAGTSEIVLAYTGNVQSLRLIDTSIASANASTNYICTASWAMPMTAGDTIQIQPFSDGIGNYTIAGAPLSSGAFNTASTFSGWRTA